MNIAYDRSFMDISFAIRKPNSGVSGLVAELKIPLTQ
jgi:hypothetical protein